jgi:hypothetical protein
MADKITPEEAKKQALLKSRSAALTQGYGLFMVTWSHFDTILEIVIAQQTKIEPIHGVIMLSGLGFERKASIARSLLALRGDTYKAAISLINAMIAEASRNALIHGQVLAYKEKDGTEQDHMIGLRFIKRDTDQVLKVTYRDHFGEDMVSKSQKLVNQCVELKNLFGITLDQVSEWINTSANLASKAGTSPKPPSS